MISRIFFYFFRNSVPTKGVHPKRQDQGWVRHGQDVLRVGGVQDSQLERGGNSTKTSKRRCLVLQKSLWRGRSWVRVRLGTKNEIFSFFSRSSDWQLWLEVQNEQKTFHLTKKKLSGDGLQKKNLVSKLTLLWWNDDALIYFLITMCHSIFVQIIPLFQYI